MKKLLLILILVLLGVQTVSGWWFDDFTTNSVASYTGYNNVWDFEPTESNLTDQNFWTPRLFYNGETYSAGNFSFKFAKNASGSNVLRPRAYFGSADLYTNVDGTWTICAADQTYYRIEAAGDFGGGNTFFLDLCDAGAYTSLDGDAGPSSWWRDNVWYYFIVNWDPAGLPSPQFPAGDTINVTAWKEGSADLIFLSSTDTTIASGYSGLGNGYWTIEYSWDWINFQAIGTAPTPTPTTTPTPTPTSTPFTFPAEPQDGLYIAGEQVQPGIISGIFLALDQNPFLLIAAVLLVYVLVTRK